MTNVLAERCNRILAGQGGEKEVGDSLSQFMQRRLEQALESGRQRKLMKYLEKVRKESKRR
jgi:hypothetical protein